MFSDDGFTESDNINLRKEVQALKEEIDDLNAKIAKRDQVNGNLVAIGDERIDEINDLRKELAAAQGDRDDKAMTTLDRQRKIKSLQQENHDLLARVGQLAGKAEETWEEGLRKHIRSLVTKAMYEYNDNSWLED